MQISPLYNELWTLFFSFALVNNLPISCVCFKILGLRYFNIFPYHFRRSFEQARNFAKFNLYACALLHEKNQNPIDF